MKILKILAVSALVFFLSVTACGYSTDTIRYKMTVEVETPSGIRSGSTVRQITLVTPPNFACSLGESRPVWRLKGEAVTVELPDGRLLFAISQGEHLDPMQPTAQMSRLFDRYGRGAHKPISIWSNSRRLKASDYDKFMPMLVTFGDVNDPSTARLVEPDELDAEFGPGFKLHRITINQTNERVSEGIEEYLPWMLEAETGMLDGSQFPNYQAEKIYENISYSDFSTELNDSGFFERIF
ncbi:MAG: hypothetical protein CL575_06545 [Altererythrobacter sp.]|nr:hypothetical protein [Altererythrobacter sp.]MBK62582.1 hypothetical protein [Altererythrobacter sp.]